MGGSETLDQNPVAKFWGPTVMLRNLSSAVRLCLTTYSHTVLTTSSSAWTKLLLSWLKLIPALLVSPQLPLQLLVMTLSGVCVFCNLIFTALLSVRRWTLSKQRHGDNCFISALRPTLLQRWTYCNSKNFTIFQYVRTTCQKLKKFDQILLTSFFPYA